MLQSRDESGHALLALRIDPEESLHETTRRLPLLHATEEHRQR